MRLNHVESVESSTSGSSEVLSSHNSRHLHSVHQTPVTQPSWSTQSFTQKPEFTQHNPNHTSNPQPMSSSSTSMTYINSPSPKNQVQKHQLNETTPIHIPPLKSMKQNNSNSMSIPKTSFQPNPVTKVKQEVAPVTPVTQISYQTVPTNTTMQANTSGKVKKERKRDETESREGKRDRKNDRCTDPELKKLKCHQGGTYRFSMSKLHFRKRI